MPLARRSNSSQEIDAVALDLGRRVGDLLGHDLPHLGEVPTRHQSSRRRKIVPSRRRVASRRWTSSCPATTIPAASTVRDWLAEHPVAERPPAGRGGLRRAALAAPVGPRRRPDPPAHHRRGASAGPGCAGRRTRSASAGPGPTLAPRRHAGAAGPLPHAAAGRRGDLVPAVQRAGRRVRPGQPRHPRRARRRRVGGQRPEDLDLAGPVLPVRHPHRPHRPRRGEARRASRTSSVPMDAPGHRDPADHRDDRRSTCSTRCSSPTCGSRPRTSSARSTAGWSLAKVTLGNERVSLSSGGALWGMGPTAERPARPRARPGRHDRSGPAPAARSSCTSSPSCCA